MSFDSGSDSFLSLMIELRNPGRDMRVLFFNSFRQLNMLFERLNVLFA